MIKEPILIKKKTKKTKYIYFSLLSVFLIIGIAYGLVYFIQQYRSSPMAITSKILTVSISESGNVAIDNAQSQKDNEGINNSKTTFNITNTSLGTINVLIRLNPNSNSTIGSNNIRFGVLEGSTVKNIGNLGVSKNILYEFELEKGESITLYTTLWLDYYYNGANEIFSGKYEVEATNTDEYGRTYLANLVGKNKGIYGINTDGTLNDGTTESINEYRYSGTNVDNYVTFNNELWRIVGVVNKKLKIVKDEPITSSISIADNSYSNSSISAYLNNYYNSLEEKSKSYVSSNDYNVGNLSLNDTYNTILTNELTTKYTGNIGLLTGKDYLYSTNTTKYGLALNDSEVSGNSWITGTYSLMTPLSDSTTEYININNNTVSTISSNITSIKPCLYLNKNIFIVGGNGTIDKPYVLSDVIEIPSKPVSISNKTVTLTNSAGKLLNNYQIYGNTSSTESQSNKPSPENPVTITSLGETNNSIDLIVSKTNTDVALYKLPKEYQQVEYLQSNGSQYIDTGIIPNNKTGIEVTTNVKLGELHDGVVIGSSDSDTGNSYVLFNGTSTSENQSLTNIKIGNVTNASIDLSDGKHTMKFNNGDFYIDNIFKYTLTDYNISATYSLWLFSLNQANSNANGFYGKLYSCKIWDNNKLVRNLVPCIRLTDGVLGMYDKISKNFLMNKGSGTFTAGKIIESESYTIDFTDHEPLRKIGDVADYIDYEKGKIVRNIGKLIFTGSEKFVINLTTYGDIRYNCSNKAFGTTNLSCDRFELTSSATNFQHEKIRGTDTSSRIVFYPSEDITTIEEWNAWLVEQYTAGTPVIVYYQLETSIEEDITLPKIKTYRDINVIQVKDDLLESTMLNINYEQRK